VNDVRTLDGPAEHVTVPAWNLIRLMLAHYELTGDSGNEEDSTLTAETMKALADQAPRSFHVLERTESTAKGRP
jgi:hypothetical protein